MRIEHWDVAFNQGKTAALNMLGRGVEHDVVPYFFSDLADWTSMEYVGPGSGDPVVRGSLDDGDFTAFYIDDGRVAAALTVGRSDDLEHAKRFIVERTEIDPAALGMKISAPSSFLSVLWVQEGSWTDGGLLRRFLDVAARAPRARACACPGHGPC